MRIIGTSLALPITVRVEQIDSEICRRRVGSGRENGKFRANRYGDSIPTRRTGKMRRITLSVISILRMVAMPMIAQGNTLRQRSVNGDVGTGGFLGYVALQFLTFD